MAFATSVELQLTAEARRRRGNAKENKATYGENARLKVDSRDTTILRLSGG
jgi:hypothetical protein